jgi:hypothetical protein
MIPNNKINGDKIIICERFIVFNVKYKLFYLSDSISYIGNDGWISSFKGISESLNSSIISFINTSTGDGTLLV